MPEQEWVISNEIKSSSPPSSNLGNENRNRGSGSMVSNAIIAKRETKGKTNTDIGTANKKYYGQENQPLSDSQKGNKDSKLSLSYSQKFNDSQTFSYAKLTDDRSLKDTDKGKVEENEKDAHVARQDKLGYAINNKPSIAQSIKNTSMNITAAEGFDGRLGLMEEATNATSVVEVNNTQKKASGVREHTSNENVYTAKRNKSIINSVKVSFSELYYYHAFTKTYQLLKNRIKQN